MKIILSSSYEWKITRKIYKNYSKVRITAKSVKITNGMSKC